MNETNNTERYIEYINSHILPFIDYGELQASYETDMVYAKGILNHLHKAMVDVYGGERLDEDVGDEGFVVIPGVLRDRENGRLCLALLELDLSSSSEHWGTSYLCKYGVIAQDGVEKVSNNDSVLKSEIKEINSTYLPYDYCYTAVIPGDIHVEKSRLPDEINAVLNDFRNHDAELQFEVDTVQGVTEVRITAKEFESKMKELLPGASAKAIKQLIDYAGELDRDGTHPKDAFFSETYVNFNLAARQYGVDIMEAVLKVCEESCLNPWEIREAASLMESGASQSNILQKSIDGELDYQPEHLIGLELGLAALKNGTLVSPAAVENSSVLERIREAEKAPKKPHKDKSTKNKKEAEH